MTDASGSSGSDQSRSGQGEPSESLWGSRAFVAEIAASALSALTAFTLSALSNVVKIPEEFRPWTILLLGLIAAFFAFRSIQHLQEIGNSATAPVRRTVVLQALAPIAALTCLAFIWNLHGTGGAEGSKTDSKASAEAAWKKTTARLKRDIKPTHHATIGCRITVRGTGWVPDNVDIWTAVLNDVNGEADTSRLYGLEKATVDGKSWATAPFNVGESEPENGHYWIYVYVVRKDVSSVLTNAVPPEGKQKVTLLGPIERVTPLDAIPVERAENEKC